MNLRFKLLKSTKLVCLVLAAVMLLSGVCYEKIKVQSFFEYTIGFQKDAFVKELEAKFVTDCSNETLGLRNSNLLGRNVVRMLPGRRQLRTFVLETPMVELLRAFTTFFSTVNVVTFEQKHPEAEVVYFIQRADGKKRA
ncbi:MAG: hypothetical protein IJW63_03000 [Lachnospiraceae bacterium]|nr:hypothetical protein [Lachnospiraceae bacterium]